MTELKEVLSRLDEIKSELDIIKGRMVDMDIVLTDEDRESIVKAEADLTKGKTKRLV